MANTKPTTNKLYVDPFEKTEDRQDSNFFDQLFGKKSSSEHSFPPHGLEQKKSPPPMRKEFTIFTEINRSENYRKNKEIEQLKEMITQEVKALKKINTSVIAEVNNIENQAIQTHGEHASEYHVRFLETLLSMIRLLRAKVSEAGTWLQAINSKKAKRGMPGGHKKASVTDQQREEKRTQFNAQ